ncbi:MAG: FmdB family zinc ribbon protein [Thermogutta sp.]
MPLYEYECPNCGKRFEHLTREGEPPECPKCGSRQLTKLLSVASARVGKSTDLPPCGTNFGCCGGGACGLG